jgi:hypothetical protein
MNAFAKFPALKPANDAWGWEGRPTWTASAFRIWRVRLVAAWFGFLLLDGVRLFLTEPADRPRLIAGAITLAGAAVIACSVLTGLAWLTRRTTTYRIGDGEVEMRFGIALKARLVIPFCAIEKVDVRVHRDGAGDIALRLKPGPSVMYPKLWPHVRPGSLMRPEPAMRCVPGAGAVAASLCREIAATERLRAALLAPPPEIVDVLPSDQLESAASA